ncbi:hypothetical protein GR268_45740, partial [Rhizobium leguminosarum]|nr:hypothetical protein [Rhizobium leguminosarum]
NKRIKRNEKEKNNFNNVLFNLGEMHRKGMGVTPDYEKARDLYYELAYKNQDARGYYGLAKLYEKHWTKDEGIDINQKILDLYTEAAKRGHTRSQFKLARIYQNGEAWGVPTNANQALGLYTEAASKGDRDARFKLAEMYYKGEGTHINYGEAF